MAGLPFPSPARRAGAPRGHRTLPAIVWLSCLLWCLPGWSQTLPAPVQAALQQARIPADAVALLVVDAEGRSAPRLSHRVDVPMNPASLTKLVTTFAALDLLGPAYRWRTPVWLDGPVVNGVLQGNLVIQGQGDPKLVLERLWLLLRRVQGLGVQRIAGDIVLDRRAFDLPESHPGDFDGEVLRPYNVAPDALLLNFKALQLTLTPEAGSARVQLDPPLAGVQYPQRVPLSTGQDCGNYRQALQLDFSDPLQLRLSGSYPAACGEQVWSLAYPDPERYNARALAGLWRSMGGALDGTVRDGPAPASAPNFALDSPPLAEVVRDINKYSNNVMAQQLFLTLGQPVDTSTDGNVNPGTPDTARAALRDWWQRRIGSADVPVLDNGSGLSRNTRISARALGQLLQTAYASALMPELMASLPLAGVDGTLRRGQAGLGQAHLKTGSLNQVSALAGYVHARSGQRQVLVAIVNDPRAAAARTVLEALLAWTLRDNPAEAANPAAAHTPP